jgi:hypothetical protein
MRTRIAALLVALALPFAVVRAQSNPCGQSCFLVFDWGNGGSPPDVDRMYGAPTSMESMLAKALSDAGWHIATGATGASMIVTIRPSVQNRVRCDSMGGTNVDMSCHTVSRAIATFVSNDTSVKAPSRVDVVSRCSDPQAYPSFPQFGQFAGETVAFQVAGGKGTRPTLKCRL